MIEPDVTQFGVIREDECPSCGEQGVVIGTSLSAEVYHCSNCDLSFLKKVCPPKLCQ